MNILEIKNIKVNYSSVEALKGIDINIKQGEVVALLGSNGAGKTTTLKAISGLNVLKEGDIIFKGESLKNKSVEYIASKKIIQSPEGRQIFTDLSVEENLQIGAFTVKSKKEIKNNFERVYKYFPVLNERKKQIAGTLSGGEQQMLAIGRALMGSPEILLLDEPSLGLAPLIIKSIFEIIKEFKKEGVTVLIVEQNALQTLKIADYAYVLEVGQLSMEGKSEDLINDPKLKEAYLGGN